MNLYIVRHGAAEPAGIGGDSERKLTGEGKEVCRRMAAALKGKIEIETVLASPLIRARQTAGIFAGTLGFSGTIGISRELMPASTPEDTILELSALGDDNIMIVGHNPHLSDLTAALVSDGSLRFDMKKAAVLCIGFSGSVGAGSGDLRWVAVPRLLL